MSTYKQKGCAFNEKELFENLDTRKIKISNEALVAHKIDKRKKLCRRIFRDCFFLVLQDLIDRNACFKLPINPRNAEIKLEKVTGERFLQAYSAGKFRNIDYLKSYFTAYDAVILLNYKTWNKRITINWNSYFYDLLGDKINAGEQYG